MNAVREYCRPATMLMPIYTYRGAYGRQALRLRFHPIIDRDQVLCDAVAEKSYKLSILKSHTSVP
jgi:hypothetical protein